ncbi:hypothetical protein BDV09DRAFT_42440 [Aspergillus tetrazonus]
MASTCRYPGIHFRGRTPCRFKGTATASRRLSRVVQESHRLEAQMRRRILAIASPRISSRRRVRAERSLLSSLRSDWIPKPGEGRQPGACPFVSYISYHRLSQTNPT